jgi:hypothetical protein
MKRSGSLREARQFPQPIERRLQMYALAAGAAGVLGLAPPADAKIIYTPANQPIGSYSLDLNHDGVVDFYLYKTWTGHATTLGGGWSTYLLLVFGQPNQFWRIQPYNVVSALPARALIGSNEERFVSGHGFMAKGSRWCTYLLHSTRRCGSGASGPWANATDRYLGLKFAINGQTHYGWARLTVDMMKNSATLTGYAYETVADKPILIGNGPIKAAGAPAATTLVAPTTEPGALGRLALGATAPKPRLDSRSH